MTDAAGNESVANLTVIQSTVLLTIDDLSSVDLNQSRITVTGTINVTDRTVWVNGVKATLYGDGSWFAENVPVNEGGTAVIQARAILNSDNDGNGTGGSGGSSSTMQNPGNPNSATAVDQNPQIDKPTEIVVISYHKNWSWLSIGRTSGYAKAREGIKWRREMSGNWWGDDCHDNGGVPDDYYYTWYEYIWGASGIGTSETGGDRGPDVCGVHAYPSSGSFTAPVNWPGEFCKGNAYRLYDLGGTAEKYDEVVARNARTLYELRTGGKKGIQRKSSLFVLSAWAAGHANLFWPELDFYSDSYSIGFTEIELGSLGRLGSDGLLYKVLGDGETYDVTPTVAGRRYYTYDMPGVSKHRLIHQTQCTALTDPRPERTNLGVGEYVNLYFHPPLVMTFPEEPVWMDFAGSVVPEYGSGTLFTAPSNAATATVRVFIRDEQMDVTFNVLEPVGYAKPPTHLRRTVPMSPSDTQAGAGMVNSVYIAPTHVSFCRIQVKEASGPATSRWGYFNDFQPLLPYHNANYWHNVNENNAWTTLEGDTAEGTFGIPLSGEWVAGGFTWHIPVYWTIGAPDRHVDRDDEGVPWPSTFMTCWDQVFELDGTGKCTITKFGVTVSRTQDDHYETSETPDRPSKSIFCKFITCQTEGGFWLSMLR